MTSLWSDDDAAAAVAHYAARGVGEDLALRTYSARLLGRDPALVMHGGGNTSVKTRAHDLFGDEIDVICVKGSGWDLAVIEPPGHPAVRLEPLRRLRALNALSDEDMVNVQRQNLMDSAAPNPSVETLLHAFLPHRFVDHTHSVAACAVANQPEAEALCREIWGARVGLVPYVMPGFALARAAADAYEADPSVEGLILLKHGVFSFGATAKESYERMIALVAEAERFIAARDAGLARVAIPARRRSIGTPPFTSPQRGEVDAAPAAAGEGVQGQPETARPPHPALRADLSPSGRGEDPRHLRQGESRAHEALTLLRGALSRAAEGAGAPSRWLLDVRSSPEIDRLLANPDLAELAARGVSTPDHVIRTKGWPVVLPAPDDAAPDGWLADVETRLAAFADGYRAYFARHDGGAPGVRKMLDPLPRLAAIPGVGLVGIGRSAAEAAIVADLAEAWAATLLRAEAVGRFEPIRESDLFDMEYWSLEQAKLGQGGGKGGEKPLARHVVVVTGAAGTIGAAIARAFAAGGAEVALLDIDGPAAVRLAAELSPHALGVACDVTDRTSVDAAFAQVAARFGGIDVVVSNAGAAWTGAMADLPDETLRASFELNLFAHQSVAQAAVRVMRRQRMGGALLFNVSKQAVNPGRDFGAYGVPKAALLALVRQYALELGADGVRVNAVNADRIRSGLLTDDMISARSRARGLSEAAYLSGNLLGREVTAEDVAQAFVASARLLATTGNVVTVDGGAVEAMLR